MKAEIIAIGTEILMGQILNTNAQFLAQQLTELGVGHYIQTAIGDNPDRLAAVTKQAEERSDIIIYSGGIGPTRDDLTKQALSAYLDEPLVYDEENLDRVRQDFSRRKATMSDLNQRMSLYFSRGKSLRNPVGQAVGTALVKDGRLYIVLPGFSKEMRAMFLEEGKALIQDFIAEDSRQVLSSRYLNYYGLGESQLAESLDDLIQSQENPTIGTYSKHNVLTLRLTASGSDEGTTQALLDTLEETINDRLGAYYYGQGLDYMPSQALVQTLKTQQKTVSVAESLTGGMAAAAIVDCPGASEIFEGGVVTYSLQAKRDVLGVSAETLDQEGMVSQACAKEMAERCRQLFQTDYALSFTGVAGPDQMEGQDVGTVFIGLAGPADCQVHRLHLSGQRENIRRSAVHAACLALIQKLN